MKLFTITKKDLLPESEAIIEGKLSKEAVEKERTRAIESFQSKITLDGFRKGHVPEKILIEKVGELSIYEEAASRALEKVYVDIIKEANINAIGFPKISITKISVGSPVNFKIETAVMPFIVLPDYKQTAKEIEQTDEIKVDDTEVDQALDDMRRSMAHHEKYHSPSADKDDVSHHSHAEADHTGKDIPEEELPELNDEFAKKLANLESLIILKEKIRENIGNEKKIRAREKNRLRIIEKIIEKSDISLPAILVDSELNRMISEFRSNLERMGVKFDDYLIQIKKDEKDFRIEWKDEAKKRAKIQLILKKISEDEKIIVDEDVIKKEVDAILTQYKDAEKTSVESYVRNVLLNEKVWEFLESQKS